MSAGMRRTVLAAVFAAQCAAMTALSPLASLAQSPTGVWNVRSQDMTDRATGGVRVVLLRVEQQGRDFAAEITSIRNSFMPVDEFRWQNNTMHVVHGSYTYTLRVDGEEISGTVASPLGEQPVQGLRQHETLMYVGDEPAIFRTERTGVLGVVSDNSGPATEVQDPRGWVTSRIRSVEDLAILNGRARVPVQFENARQFERQLMELAGSRVTIRGVWVGDKIRLESIEPAAP